MGVGVGGVRGRRTQGGTEYTFFGVKKKVAATRRQSVVNTDVNLRN